MRRRYEISDEEWNVIEPFLPPTRKPQGGRPPKDRRQMLNAVLWIARTGAPWRDLPAYYGSWSSAYSFFLALTKGGDMGHHFGSCFDRTRLESGHDRHDRSPCPPAWIGRKRGQAKQAIK